jgi:hypothetical protein
MAKSTLINSAGKKVIVDSGSSQANQYFGQGYKLMGGSSAPATPTIPSMNRNPGAIANPSILGQGSSPLISQPKPDLSSFKIASGGSNEYTAPTINTGIAGSSTPMMSNKPVVPSITATPAPVATTPTMPAIQATAPATSTGPAMPNVPATTPAAAPAAPTKTIYRIGKDIYDAQSKRKLGYDEFMTSYNGRAKEISAPPSSASTTPTLPEVPKTSDGQNINPATGGVSAPSALDTAMSDVEKYTAPSAEETKSAEELNAISESLRQGYLGEGDRPIPMGFITGRQKSLETRAATMSQPIQAAAALAQAKRLAALDAAKFRATTESGKIADEKEASKPIAVGSGSSLIDPRTGQPIYTAPTAGADAFTLGAGQKRYDAAGNLIASAPESSSSSAPTVKTFGQTDYTWNEQTGQWDPVSLSTNSPQAKVDKANKLLADIADLKGTKGMEDSVGFKGASSLWGFLKNPIAGSPAADYLSKLNSIVGQLTLENMGVMKGVLSDSDMKIISQASTALNKDMSEPEFKKELAKIEAVMQKVVQNSGADSGTGNAAEGGFSW